MSHTIAPSSVVLNDVSLTWPDGNLVLDKITAAFATGRTGLVGANGSGKSTLLRLIAGELTPTTGTVTVTGDVEYLPQRITRDNHRTVADLLGVRTTLDALRAIEAGHTTPANFDAVGDDWDVVSRSASMLAAAGLGLDDLDRPTETLSGGEAVLAAVAGLRGSRSIVSLLDEPTNNLDRMSRERLYTMIDAWKGTLIVVSHDRELLELVDATAELRSGSLTLFGGTYSEYEHHVTVEQGAAARAVNDAEKKLRTERAQRVEAETKLARRARYAKTDFANKRMPKVVMNMRKSEAQVSAGKMRTNLDAAIESARNAVDEAESRVRDDVRIRVELPDPGVADGRRILEVTSADRTLVVQGPEKVALMGPNGVGKTTVLETLVGKRASGRRVVLPEMALKVDRVGYLPQRMDVLDDARSVLDNVRAGAPDVDPNTVRAQLAKFLVRGRDVHRRAATLSGGERFRVTLARLLLADPPAQLVVLDEPTNNLDLDSVDQLVDALAAYRGALLVVSHDFAFLDRLGINRWWTMTSGGVVADHAERPR